MDPSTGVEEEVVAAAQGCPAAASVQPLLVVGAVSTLVTETMAEPALGPRWGTGGTRCQRTSRAPSPLAPAVLVVVGASPWYTSLPGSCGRAHGSHRRRRRHRRRGLQRRDPNRVGSAEERRPRDLPA